MRTFLRRHATPPMFVALLALVLSVSGVSYAAHTISGKASGGSDRTVSSARVAVQPTLPSGKTMRGYFTGGAGDSTDGYFGEGITFPYSLPNSFNRNHVQYLYDGDAFTNQCPGTGQAKKGWVCMYEGQSNNTDVCCIYDNAYNSYAVSKYGFRIYWDVLGSGSYADGMWAVTAP